MVMKYVQLGDFTTQAGAVIPQVRIAYETVSYTHLTLPTICSV